MNKVIPAFFIALGVVIGGAFNNCFLGTLLGNWLIITLAGGK